MTSQPLSNSFVWRMVGRGVASEVVMQMYDMQGFNPRTVNDVEIKKQYRVKIPIPVALQLWET